MSGILHRLRTALAREEVGLFDPFVYRLADRLGVLYLVPGLKERWRILLEARGTALNASLGVAAARLDIRGLMGRRLDAPRARKFFGANQADNPLVLVLRDLASDLRRTGATVLLYVPPINVPLLEQLGVREELRLPERIEAIRAAVGATPEEWLDLHAVAPPGAFRDWVGHMAAAGCERVADALSDALVPRLERAPGP